jgi:hypothetical protein
MRYSLAMPYLKNHNAFFDISLGFFIAVLSMFVNLPIVFKLQCAHESGDNFYFKHIFFIGS